MYKSNFKFIFGVRTGGGKKKKQLRLLVFNWDLESGAFKVCQMHYQYFNLFRLWGSNKQTSEYEYMSRIGIVIDFVCWNPEVILVKPNDITELFFYCNKFLEDFCLLGCCAM